MLKASQFSTACFVAIAVATPACAEGVSAVTLSSGGLAEILSTHRVDGSASLRIQVPADQIDDVLKSLVVRDAGGAVGSITLDGPAQAEETLRRMPFKADDIASPARLANALQGVRIQVVSDGKTIEGMSLGVSERNGGQNAGAVRTLAVMTEAGFVDTVNLVEGASLKVLDPDMQAKIKEAVAAIAGAKAEGARAVEIALSGAAARDVGVSYVVSAPVWKTAYRVMSDDGAKARVQAWAIIENATGADWKDVAVTLQAGAPVTLRQRLFQRYWRQRPEVPVDVEEARVPQVDQGAMAALAAPPPPAPKRMNRAMAIEQEAFSGAQADMIAAAPAQAQETAEATESAVSASYRLPSPVTLAAGRTLSTPLVDADMPAERVSLFKRGSGVHPVAAISIRNDTKATLPPGILTVYDKAVGYAGDARLPATPVGEERMASFATDRKVKVTSETTPEETIAEVSVADGMARIRVRSREITQYRVSGAVDDERTLVIDHPKREGWRFASPDLSSESPEDYRLKVRLAAGESRVVKATLETDRLDLTTIAEADATDILRWATTAADGVTAEKLKKVAAARKAEAGEEREIARLDALIERLTAEQQRIQGNLGRVAPQTDFGKRLVRQLEIAENEIGVANAGRNDAQKRLQERQDAVRALVGSAEEEQ